MASLLRSFALTTSAVVFTLVACGTSSSSPGNPAPDGGIDATSLGNVGDACDPARSDGCLASHDLCARILCDPATFTCVKEAVDASGCAPGADAATALDDGGSPEAAANDAAAPSCADAGAVNAGDAGVPCQKDGDCPSGYGCGFPLSDGCCARGVCALLVGGGCAAPSLCACDGTLTRACRFADGLADAPVRSPVQYGSCN